MACQQSQRLRRAQSSHEAAEPPMPPHKCVAPSQQAIPKPSRHQLAKTKTCRLCGAPRQSSAPQPKLFSQSVGPPQPAPQHIASQWHGGSLSSASEVLDPAFPAAAVRKLPNPVRQQSCGRGLTSRSSADPLRRATGPARPYMSIIGLAGPVSRRSGRLSSNVRPQRTDFLVFLRR